MLEITKSFGPPAVAGRVLWIKVCPSICLSFFLAVLLELAHYCSFSENLYGVRRRYVRDRARFFEKTPPSKNDQMFKNGPKIGFLDFLGKYIHLFCLEMV